MHPFLFDLHIGGHLIRPPSYGFLLAMAFSLAYFYSLKQAGNLGIKSIHIERLFIIVVACSVVGARMFHVLFEEFSYYLANPSKIIAVWEGGYTLYGAILVGMVGVLVYCQKQKLNYLDLFDFIAPATLLGIAIGRTGCFLAGCCWGLPTDLPWGVVFSHPEGFSVDKLSPLHPTQLYEAIIALCFFIFTHLRLKKRIFSGQIFCESLILYSLLRFGIEYFRGDLYRGFVFGELISYSQFISLLILPFAAAGWMHLKRKQLGN